MLSTILIVEEKKELYAEIYHFNQGIADSNYALLPIPKEELAKILQSKGKTFRMKVIIWKF